MRRLRSRFAATGVTLGFVTLRIGDCFFDPTTGEVRGPAGSTRLRRQAARALELLAGSPGRLVTREALRAHIWGETHVDFVQGLNTCIKEVRNALGDGGEVRRYVETFPRRGYRLIARVEPADPESRRVAPLPTPGRPPGPRRPGSRGWAAVALAAAVLAIAGTLRATAPDPGWTGAPGVAAADAELERLLARGRHLLRTRDRDALDRSLGLLQDAVGRNPRDARVWSALADLHRVLADRRPARRARHASAAERAATRALELDPLLAAAHASRAAVLDDAGRLGESEAAFERAIALDPGDPTARHWYADLLRRQGRLDEALVQARAAREADPLSAGACTSLAYVHLLRGELEPARSAFREALSIEPDFVAAWLGLSRVHVQAREWDRALETLARPELPAPIRRAERAYALARSGRAADARRLLAEMKAAGDGAQSIAAVHAGLGEPDAALAWLERGFAAEPPSLRSLPADPRFEPLAGDARFEDLLDRLARALHTGRRPAGAAGRLLAMRGWP